jgi:exoribonuclease R
VHARHTPDVAAVPDDRRGDLVRGFAALRDQLGIAVDFPPDVIAAAEQAAKAPRLPDHDATDIPFVTLDPPGSKDLDQAVHLGAKKGGGYVVHYAIADVAAFVAGGDPVDTEARRRVQTEYAPDQVALLHPSALSEGSASLLPDQARPAFVWTIELDADGSQTSCLLQRSMVRSRQQLDYPGVEAALAAGNAPDPIALLGEIGKRRRTARQALGSLDLPVPEQQVLHQADGHWSITLRAESDVESWNAEISLLTGMAAAQIMLDAKVGVLRTLPPASPDDLARVRKAATAIGIDWPDSKTAGEVLAALDPSVPINAAFADLAAELLRGAGYTAFDGNPPTGDAAVHAGIGGPYAHVTAPLRRLCDRFALEACAAAVAGQELPEWARSALGTLPDLMAESDKRSHELDRGVVDLTEAWLLADRVGETFDAMVVDVHHDQATVVLDEPPVRGRCDGKVELGTRTKVRLTEADPAQRSIRFTTA